MAATNFTKIFAVLTLAGALVAGCSRGPGKGDSPERPQIGPEISRIPFAAREPDVFQAEIVITAGDSVRVTRIARSGARRRIEIDADRPSKLILFSGDRQVLFLPEGRLCAEAPVGNAFTDDEVSGSLTARWLTERADAGFEKIETRDGLTVYRVRFGEGDLSEATVAVDEALGIVMKQEFVSIVDGERQTSMTVEIRDLKSTAEEPLFEVPAGCRKMKPAELINKRHELEKEQ